MRLLGDQQQPGAASPPTSGAPPAQLAAAPDRNIDVPTRTPARLQRHRELRAPDRWSRHAAAPVRPDAIVDRDASANDFSGNDDTSANDRANDTSRPSSHDRNRRTSPTAPSNATRSVQPRSTDPPARPTHAPRPTPSHHHRKGVLQGYRTSGVDEEVVGRRRQNTARLGLHIDLFRDAVSTAHDHRRQIRRSSRRTNRRRRRRSTR